MKLHIYLLLGALALTQCKDNTGLKDDENTLPDKENYTSYWYYSYEAEQQFDGEDFGLEHDTFSPYTVSHKGDTLFVANVGSSGPCILLQSQKTGKVMKTLRSWQFNNEEKTFGSVVDAIFPTQDRLYVAERESRIHVFSLPSLEYISCIGNGSWSGQVFQAQALIVKDGLVFARDKDSGVSLYKEEDITPANYQNVKRWRKTAQKGAANNGFHSQSMTFDETNRILLTDFAAKKIRTLDPALITADFQSGTSIDVESEEIPTEFNPKTLAKQGDRLYVTGGNGQINVYDCQLRKWVRAFKTVSGFGFSQPERIYAKDNTVLWVSDQNKRTLVKVVVYKNEIREYETMSKHVIKVKKAMTRNGATSEEFYVDLRTHEIIDPEEAE